MKIIYTKAKRYISRFLSITFIMTGLMSCQTSPDAKAQISEKYGLNNYNTPQVTEELQYIEKNTKPISPNPNMRILITGSTAGLGQLTAKMLIAKGYKVVIHARNEARAQDAKRDLPGAEAVLICDLSDLNAVKKFAKDINALGSFDVIIHNAGTMPENNTDGTVFRVNSVAPYLLTCLVEPPKTLIYVSSDLHRSASLSLNKMQDSLANISYSDTKLQILTFAKAVARKWPNVRSNAITPGWIPTKMGGSSAPDDLRQAYSTLVWLAEGKDKATQVTGKYFFKSRIEPNYNKIADDTTAQDDLLNAYFKVTNVPFLQK